MLGFDAIGKLAIGTVPNNVIPARSIQIQPAFIRPRVIVAVALGSSMALLTATATQAPFNSNIQTRVNPVRFNRPDQVSLNLNLYKNPVPFAQTDWSHSFRVSNTLPPHPAQNASIFYPATTQNPFAQYDWSKPFRPPAGSPALANNIPILEQNSTPFVPVNFSTPKAFIPSSPAQILNLLALTPIAPFIPFDWSSRTALRFNPLPFQLPVPLPLFPVVAAQAPFAQYDWPLVRRIGSRLPAFEFFILPGVSPPIPPIPPVSAQKIIALDAAYGSSDVIRFFRRAVPSAVVAGDAVAIMVEAGELLDPTASFVMHFTKPDGTTLTLASPAVYVGLPQAPTSKGIFEAQTYAIGILSGQQVDQHGYWHCFLQSGVFASKTRAFYIGPPPVLV